jgi:outer membrane protein assembly factor BamB
MRRTFTLGLVTALLATADASAQSNWPQFRGSQSLGISDAPGLPDSWSTTQNVVWKTDIPGRGWSSPIVWGDRIFLTSVINEGQSKPPKKGLYFGGDQHTPPKTVHRWMVYCIDWKTGKILWEKMAHKGVPESTIHIKNSYASETPVTDGQRVYAYFGNLGLFCYDMDGKELWSRKWGTFKTRLGWGTAASPVLYKDRVYIVNDNEQKSFIAAIDKRSGEEVWHVARDEKSNWAPPYIWENTQRTEIVTPGTGKVRSYDLDGHLLWELKGMSSITIPVPFSRDDLLYVCSGYIMDKKKPVFAIRPGATGDISLQEGQTANNYIAWFQKLAGPYNPSPLLYGPYFYVLKDRGFFSCYDARTGKEIYVDQRLGGATAFTCSPWAYDGKIFCLSEDGDAFVIKAGPKFEIIRKNSLGEMCMATPAIANGSLLVRTETKLYRLGNAIK